jgi:crossover junction endodeoxyribonuclease RusA
MTDRVLVRLPWPPAKSSPNGGQRDFRGKARAGKAYKDTCAKECWAQAIRRMDADAASVVVTFHPPIARAYDLDNALAKAKRGLDAVSEAVGIDDAKWSEIRLKRGEKVKGGCVLVELRGQIS